MRLVTLFYNLEFIVMRSRSRKPFFETCHLLLRAT
jgi:hypothetical protein